MLCYSEKKLIQKIDIEVTVIILEDVGVFLELVNEEKLKEFGGAD